MSVNDYLKTDVLLLLMYCRKQGHTRSHLEQHASGREDNDEDDEDIDLSDSDISLDSPRSSSNMNDEDEHVDNTMTSSGQSVPRHHQSHSSYCSPPLAAAVPTSRAVR